MAFWRRKQKPKVNYAAMNQESYEAMTAALDRITVATEKMSKMVQENTRAVNTMKRKP